MRHIDAAAGDNNTPRTPWSGRSLLAATRRLGVVVLAVLCVGAASVSNAQVASAGLLGPASTVRVIVTSDSVDRAQAVVDSVGGHVVTTLPIVDGVVADVSSSLLPVAGGVLDRPGVTVTLDVPVAVGPLPSAAVDLGTAADASVLAGSGVTNTGPSVLNHDLDTYPTPAVTGFPPGKTMGTQHAADAVALAAQNDLTTAYNAAVAAPSTSDVTGVNLGGKTLPPGVYTAAASMALTGPLPLTLDGPAGSVFIFQAGSTLITGSNSSVILTGGVQASNVFWQVGSSATLGTGTHFTGNILALTSITVTTGASIDGRALARNGAVTLDNNIFGSVTPPSGPTAVFPQTSQASSLVAAGTDGRGVNVAVIDTGINDLPDFAGRLVGGVDLSGGNNPFADSYGHGTFVAGLIAGNGASSAGQYVGEAPGAGLVSVKVAGVSGLTDMATVIAGLQWVVANHARLDIRVVNLSLGVAPSGSTVEPARPGRGSRMELRHRGRDLGRKLRTVQRDDHGTG